MAKQRVRIKDIAIAAGVSTGTVDRVIHNRGNVLPEVKKRVEAVMKKLDYQPNIMASTLANNKVIKIATLLPDFQKDAYWESPYQGIEKAVSGNAHFSITVNHHFFDRVAVKDFEKQANKIFEDIPDAIIIAPIFGKEAKQFLKDKRLQNVAVVLINNRLSLGEKVVYIGQDSYQSGVLAGRLLSTNQGPKSTYLLLHLEVEEKALNATHIHQKEAGFYDYFKENHPESRVLKRAYSEFQKEHTLTQFLEQTIKETPKLTGICVSTSKTHQLLDRIGDKLKNATIVGFDLLPKNIEYLKAGKIDYLINQNPEKQGFLAIVNLIDQLVLRKEVKAIQYLPLDIVVKENVVYYSE